MGTQLCRRGRSCKRAQRGLRSVGHIIVKNVTEPWHREVLDGFTSRGLMSARLSSNHSSQTANKISSKDFIRSVFNICCLCL